MSESPITTPWARSTLSLVFLKNAEQDEGRADQLRVLVEVDEFPVAAGLGRHEWSVVPLGLQGASSRLMRIRVMNEVLDS
jgi:hypothetical protein